ncbi:metal ABC transporter ATP-binding protein [Corynebacterium tuberculostearicum]|uniref:metal ABC transporter ATP-binding protein n=1 Tax=Corynebacterium tuberculostearicum TaxID=38304 RepID=UPI00254BEB0A|nr:ABC transporter ATP-binding protein [Corynebacterium tuberculostearicum]MDK8676890.1 ABC transporter ATP-binding protein [Corynebacterium tuberculostearicum]
MLRATHLTAGYPRTPVLADATFALTPATITGLVGANGSGKSTLVRTLVGLLPPLNCESLTFDGTNLAHFRHRLGYMPQHAEIDWDFPATAFDVALMGRTAGLRWWQWPSRVDKRAAHDALARTGMQEHSHLPISALSGGQRQRVLLARTLVSDPELIILDEPFAGVDAASQRAIMEVLENLRADGATILLVHHNLAEVADFCDEVLMVGQGRLIAAGPTKQVLTESAIADMFCLPS